jgi:hypothetical protein
MDQCPASIWQAVKVLRASESSSLARGNKAAAARLPGNPPACGDDDEDAPGDLTFEDPGGMDGTEGDAVLMLMLMCMDLGVLQEQVPAGARLVKMLDDSLHVLSDDHARRQLVSETRKFLLGSDAAFWKDAARHVSSVSQKLFDMPRGKKDEVMRKFSQHPARKSRPLSCMPSLLQIVYGTGSRSHVMLDSWMDSLCIMQGKLKGVPPPRGVVQFIEVPNLMQRVMKVYVDWDLLLSTVERSGFFADHCHLGLDSPEAQVEYLRNLALRTPAVMCTILRDAGLLSAQQDAQVGTRALGGESVFVLVKEGTRKAACHVSPAASAGAAACGASAASAPVQALQFPRLDGGKTNGRVDAGISSHQANHGSDWKISFHFIFQILVSQSQFEAVYNLVTSKVASESADLAMVLNCVSIRGWESSSAMKLGHSTHSLQDAQAAAMGSVLRRYAASGGGSAPAAGTSAGDADCMAALIGLDLHPKQNAHQGLACLGSRKPAPTSQVSAAAAAAAAAPSSKLLGMIRVELGSPSDKQRERRRLCAWEWVEGYASSAHPLLVLAESSILAPGPRCVGLCSDGCNAVGGSERYPGCTPIPAAFALAPSAPSGASKRKRLLHPDVAVAPASKGHRNIRPCAGLGSGSDDAEPSSRRPVFSRCGGGEGVTSAAAKSLSPPMLAARSNSTSPPPSYHPLPALGGTMAAGRVRSSPAPITSCSQQPLGSLCLSPLASGSLLSRQGLSNHARRVVSREDVMNSMPLWFKMQVGRLRASLGGFSPACQTSLRSSPTQPSPPFAGGSHGSKVGVDGSSLAEVFRTMRTDMQSLSVPMQVSKLSSKCFFAQVYQTEICMCTLSMMQVPFKVGGLFPCMHALSFICAILWHPCIFVYAFVCLRNTLTVLFACPVFFLCDHAGIQVPQEQRGCVLLLWRSGACYMPRQ